MHSGFCFDKDNLLYMINTNSYNANEDKACFDMSCKFHKMENKILDNEFTIKRADVEFTEGWKVSISFNDNGNEEYRVYKVKDN